MFNAGQNFNHVVQDKRDEHHVLVTSGEFALLNTGSGFKIDILSFEVYATLENLELYMQVVKFWVKR